MNPPALAKSSLLRIIIALALLLLGAVFLTVRHADTLLERALLAAFGPHQHEYRSVWFDWNGNVVAKEVVLRAEAGGELRFGRVWLRTPGWGFFLRNALDRRFERAALAHLDLRFTEGQDTAGLHALLPEFGPIGAASGAPFESAGCRSSESFSLEDLAQMGLSIGDTSLEVEQRLEGDRIATMLALETQGSSRTQLERSGVLAELRATLLGERAAANVESERWSVRDQGFVPARNRHCAQNDGVVPRDFPELHIAALDALLEAVGLDVDDNTRAFYRRFARSGGEMAFGGAYQPPLSPRQSARRGARALARMNATLERDTRAVPIVWTVSAVAEEEEEPVEPVVETQAAVPTPAEEPAPTPVVVAPLEPVAPPPVEPTPAPTPSETPPPTPSVASDPRPARPRIERAPPAPKRATLAWEDLARHRGRQIRLWTVHNPPRTVELLDASGDELRVRARLGGGAAEYTVKREGFLRATVLDE